MAIVKMKHVRLIGENSRRTDILRDMMWLKSVDVSPLNDKMEDPEWSSLLHLDSDTSKYSEYNAQTDDLRQVIDLLSPFAKGKKSLFTKPHALNRKDFDEYENNSHAVLDKVSQVLEIKKNLSFLHGEKNKTTQLIDALIPWQDCPIEFDKQLTRHTELCLGTVSSETDISLLEESLNKDDTKLYLEQVYSDDTQKYFAVISYDGYMTEALQILSGVHFNQISFRDLSGTPKQNILALNNKLKELTVSIEKSNEQLHIFAESLDIFETSYDISMNLMNMYDIKNKLLITDKVFLLDGWCPENRLNDFINLAEEYRCYIESSDPDNEQEPPVALKNNFFASAFEGITEMYALPLYRGIDPTPFMAPFYCLFFGMMLGDAGYGLLITLACAIVLLFGYLRPGMKKTIQMFLYCGISTTFWGFMFGSCFGNVIPVFSDVFLGHEVQFKALWIEPLSDPMTILTASFAIGIIHLIVGLAIKFYLLCRDGQVLDAIFDSGFWIIFLIGIPVAIGPMLYNSLPSQMSSIGLYMMAGALLGLVLTQGRHSKNIFGKIGGGLKSIYDVTGYISDILSYARIFALGLSTTVVATVFNQLATLAGNTVFGVILFVVIFVLSTALNVALNMLSAYVHASRLQFIEFFSKFYESGGTPYQPVKIDTQYSQLK